MQAISIRYFFKYYQHPLPYKALFEPNVIEFALMSGLLGPKGFLNHKGHVLVLPYIQIERGLSEQSEFRSAGYKGELMVRLRNPFGPSRPGKYFITTISANTIRSAAERFYLALLELTTSNIQKVPA